ncbi:peptide ABC transporter permease, partial [Nonomuraea sp. NPDC055795]
MILVARMLVRRVLILIPLLLGVIAFVFIVMRFSSSKPEYAYFQGANPTAEQIRQFQLENGLLDPLPVR